MFHQANNFVINGGQFTVADNNHDAVSTILLHHIASGAIFDSDERHSAGRCHPRTRQSILDRVKKWIEGTNSNQRILWMYGSAGAGKSSLMQSICELLRNSVSETNGASFFFSRGHPDRGKGSKLFVTLAYQLAVQFPSVRAEINNALYRDPTLPTKSMAIQLQSLIIDPLLRSNTFLSPTPVLFIDGLDECDADEAQGVDRQRQIIGLILQSLVEYNIPVRFMIASRPEYWIRDSFETSPLSDISLLLSLRDDIDADDDIWKYLTENFEQIRLKKSRTMRSVVLPWPPRHIVDRFVEDASGQYIYASTILKFIGDHPFKNPEEQLRIITTPGPHRATAFTEVDGLYATIVSAHPAWETMKHVLGGLLINVNLTVIRVILGVPQTEITLVLDALSSLIDVVPPAPLSEYDQLLIPIFGSSFEDEKISFCHLSFREFLLDEARSGSYYIDIKSIHMEVMGAFFGIIQRNLDANYEIEPHVSCNMSLSEYRRMMNGTLHFFPLDSSYDYRGLSPVLNSTMERFRRFDPDRRMNHPACFMRDMDFLFNSLSQMSHTIVNTKEKHKPDVAEQTTSMDSFLAIAKQLQNLARMAHKISIHLLSLCDGFSVTRTLFFIRYLTRSHNNRLGVEIRDLLTNPGCTVDDCVSSMQQHRHIININLPSRITRTELGSVVLISVVDLEESCHDPRLYWQSWTTSESLVVLKEMIVDSGCWLCPTKWTRQRVFLVRNCLKSILSRLDNDWEHLDKFFFKHFILADFFDDSGISDIYGKTYFEKEHHLSILEVMVDSKAWTSLFPSRPRLWSNLAGVIVPILCWFNRQLTNPKTCKLIVAHDPSLLSKMTTAMNTIFHKCFLPNFETPYFSELVVSTSSGAAKATSIKIKVLSSSYSEEEIEYCPVEDHDVYSIQRIQTELFDFGMGPRPTVHQSPIPCSEWYPYLAAYLLNVSVKNLYCRKNWTFLFGEQHERHWKQSFFPCLVQCLPYAQTTAQNLDALRAIKYLSKGQDPQNQPQTGWYHSPPRFHPPSGFCSAAEEFLKRYERSALSSEELTDFQLWLRGVTEAYPGESSADFELSDWSDFGKDSEEYDSSDDDETSRSGEASSGESERNEVDGSN